MQDTRNPKEAVLWEPAEEKKVKCYLCNFHCVIGEGKMGRCRVRKNIEGELYSMNYHKVCSAAVDPIEKKPLFHFLPGSRSFSIACPGCNFQCEFCQNWQISQIETDVSITGSDYSPELIVEAAVDNKCKSIAYTYTEPTIFMELAADCGQLAKERGLKNVFVSNGYMTKEAVDFAKGWLDGINIDLKSFDDEYYKKLCKARLEPVLETIKYIAENTGIWMEITTLIVPGQNDSDDELERIANFVSNLRDGDVPWHISRFYPNYKMDGISATAEDRMLKAYRYGKDLRIKHVYLGNIYSDIGQNTFCPRCDAKVIDRTGYSVDKNKLNDGQCAQCGQEISGFFKC